MTVRQQPKVSRCGKRRKMRWPDEHTAERAREHRQALAGKPLWTYFCGRCEGFHLTSHAPREQ